MVMQVLQNESEIARARDELESRQLSALDSGLHRQVRRVARKLKLTAAPSVGDRVKSWDVLKTIQFLEQNVPKTGAVLDLGAYASEILVALHRLGYRNLAGVDLNPGLRSMPHADSIRYEISNFLRSSFSDASFDAITSISVIEHGFQAIALLTEVGRLLRPGGYFISSFDYWPEKIATDSIKLFDMDWRIFSSAEVEQFVLEARQFGFAPFGPLNLSATDKAIKFAGQEYTFGWLVLRKGD